MSKLLERFKAVHENEPPLNTPLLCLSPITSSVTIGLWLGEKVNGVPIIIDTAGGEGPIAHWQKITPRNEQEIFSTWPALRGHLRTAQFILETRVQPVNEA